MILSIDLWLGLLLFLWFCRFVLHFWDEWWGATDEGFSRFHALSFSFFHLSIFLSLVSQHELVRDVHLLLAHDPDLGQHVLQDALADPTHVEGEGIGSRVQLPSFTSRHPILCSCGEAEPGTKRFEKDGAIFTYHLKTGVDVPLAVRHLLHVLDLVALLVIQHALCLVAAAPYDEVSSLNMRSLFLPVLGLHQFDSLLSAFLDLSVQLFRISAQTSE